MRYWFDLLTPKQLFFFKPVLEGLESSGHEVLATSRSYREVEQLASLLGIPLRYVGKRGDRDPIDQLRASIDRMRALLPIVTGFAPEMAVSVASADCARLAFGMRVRHVAVNDSPHSVVAGRLSLPLSQHLVAPWIIPFSAWASFGLTRSSITTYRALDPAAWLKRRHRAPHGRRRRSVDGRRKTIVVRLEESYAPYMIGTDEGWTGRVLSTISREFRDLNLIALCRYESQLEWVKSAFGDAFVVPDSVVDGASLLEQADAFVGMGGTMTTESALLGVPTVSAYQGGKLYTETYLLSKSLLQKARNARELVVCLRRSLDDAYRTGFEARARRVLDRMEDPVKVVLKYITQA